MSRRGAGRDGCFRSFRRLVNGHASHTKKFDRFANTRNSGIHSTKCKTFRFALPTGNLFTKGNEIRAWFQLGTRKAFGKISDCKVYKSMWIMLIQAHWTGCGLQGYEFLTGYTFMDNKCYLAAWTAGCRFGPGVWRLNMSSLHLWYQQLFSKKLKSMMLV